MDWLSRLFPRTRAVFERANLDREFDAELSSHLELAIEENLRSGMSPEEARRRALIRLGGVQQSREKHREERGLPLLEIFTQDLQYTARTLRRKPAFTLITVLILGLGIGANIVVFNVVNGILLRPLPFSHAAQLTWIATGASKAGLSSQTFSADAFDELRQRNRSFQDIAGYFAFSAPTDPQAFAGAVLVLALTALLAGLLPALRASRVHPMTALRSA